MREFFSNAWNMFQPQSWYVLLPVKRQRYMSDSTVSGLSIFHDVPTFMSCIYNFRSAGFIRALQHMNFSFRRNYFWPVHCWNNSSLLLILLESIGRNCNRSMPAANTKKDITAHWCCTELFISHWFTFQLKHRYERTTDGLLLKTSKSYVMTTDNRW